jgi:hypothetical protein
MANILNRLGIEKLEDYSKNYLLHEPPPEVSDRNIIPAVMEAVKDVQNSVHGVLLLNPIDNRRTITGVCAIAEEDPDIRKPESSRALKRANDQVSS